MIKRTEESKQLDNLFSDSNKQAPGLKKYLKKKDVENFNKFNINISIDPSKFIWKTNCKKCLGKGFIGTNVVDNKLIPCKCLRIKQTKTD